VLFTLPKRLNEEEIFIIQDYVKKFEKLGFDAGQKYANELKDREIDTIEKDYKVEMMRMKAENDRISSMLDKYMLENMIASDAECEQSKIGIPIHML
jgi:DNA mismatch repair ATPase MutL